MLHVGVVVAKPIYSVMYLCAFPFNLATQCLSNGINYEKLQKGSGCNVQTLEMFFSGFPNICGMENFPKLRVLVLVGLDIEHIENLDCLSNLYELWIAECKLSVSMKKFYSIYFRQNQNIF